MSNMKIANYTFIINPMQKSTHTGFITVQGTVKHWLYIWMHQRFFLVRSPLKAQNAYKTEATQRTHMYNPANVHVYKRRPSERATHIVPTLVSHAFTLNMLPQLFVKQQGCENSFVLTWTVWSLFVIFTYENAVRGSGHCLNIIHWHCKT